MRLPRLAATLLCLLLLAPVLHAAPPRFEGLGDFTRPVSTANADAQAYFDQGLAFMYAFNHDEAIRSFTEAARLDPAFAMAQWGIAIASGPHINKPAVPPERERAAVEAIAAARKAAAGASAVERALIEAQATRFADPQPADRAPLDLAYADAMRKVWQNHPKDADVGALFAESLADLRPWDLWQADGSPQPGTEELIATLDTVLKLDPRHPLANHLYIHALEASPWPERADAAADMLRDLQPGLGHLVHMPSHIDVRRGRWQASIDANAKAIVADDAYADRSPAQDFYRLYMSHNRHMLAFSAMMNGQSELALSTMRAMAGRIPADFLQANPWADGFIAMPLEVLMRFGRWEEILAEPPLPDHVPLSRALQHYARGVAYAATGRLEQARAEQQAFAAARAAVPADTPFGNNLGHALLDIAERVMGGEIAFRAGDRAGGLALLEEAAAKEEALRYDEPPDWIQPARHPWGAALLQAGMAKEAEAVFRADLQKHPGNGWGLYGLMRALELQDRDTEARAVEREFDAVWAKADVKIKSPCLCFPGV
jgi:tetratricopeptide (TPR) repeat protein